MKHHAGSKLDRKTEQASQHHSSAGDNALAIAPPDYGIDFADHGSNAATIQCVGLPRKKEPFQSNSGDAQSSQQPNRTGLPDSLKAGVASLSGMSMDHVRVHFNSSKPARINALAYTQGSEIHVAPGQQRHLPHEAWHVVQQAQGRVSQTVPPKDGRALNNDQGLEREADVMGWEQGRSR